MRVTNQRDWLTASSSADLYWDTLHAVPLSIWGLTKVLLYLTTLLSFLAAWTSWLHDPGIIGGGFVCLTISTFLTSLQLLLPFNLEWPLLQWRYMIWPDNYRTALSKVPTECICVFDKSRRFYYSQENDMICSGTSTMRKREISFREFLNIRLQTVFRCLLLTANDSWIASSVVVAPGR